MSERIIENALITKTTLGTHDAPCFNAWLILDYSSGTSQGFGGYAMDDFNKALDRRVGTAWGMEFIARVMEVVGVSRWEDLEGKHLRVDHTSWGKIHRIGNLMKDVWFNPEEDLKFLISEKAAQ